MYQSLLTIQLQKNIWIRSSLELLINKNAMNINVQVFVLT
jgi:hypothetical protein